MSFKLTFVDGTEDAELVDADADRIRAEVLSLDPEQGTFVILESLADPSGMTFAQVRPNYAQPEKCDFEYRDGPDSRQLATVLPSWSDGADILLAWASGDRRWRAGLEWGEVAVDGLGTSGSQSVESDFEDLDGLDSRARDDLRSAMALLAPNRSSFFSLRWLWTDLRTIDSMRVLSAMMAPHDEVRIRDPRAAAERVNRLLAHERSKQHGLRVQHILDVSPSDLVLHAVSDLEAAPSVLRLLPLASRSHLVDIWTLSRGLDVGSAGRFWPMYGTRQTGLQPEEGLTVLIDHGLLQLCEDEDKIVDHQTMSMSGATLRELLTDAGVAFQSRASKAALAGLARPIVAVSRPTQNEPLYGLTVEGRRAVDWMKERTDRTMRMWGVWAASRAPE